MIVEYIAHSCFKVTLEKSEKTIVFDPFGEEIGYKMPHMHADYVVCSHEHYDHNNTDALAGSVVLDAKKGFKCNDFSIEGIETVHDAEGGKLRGMNTAIILRAEGLTLMHMGDIGCIPDEEFFERAGKIDVLMIPVGGIYTIDAEQAVEICKIMEPNIIIPMHYKTLFLEIDVDSIYKFTDAAKGYFDRAHCASTYQIRADNLKKRSRILVMNYAAEEA